MAKRYHDSKKSESHSYREKGEMKGGAGAGGMIVDRHRASNHNDEMYAGELQRRHLEMQDAGMIHDDPRAIANLPQEVMIKPYPKTGPYNPEDLNDDISGVDHQMDYDDSQRARNFYPKKV